MPCVRLGSPARVKVFFRKLANTDHCLGTGGARHRRLVEVSSGHTCQWFLLCGQNSAWIMGMEATLCQSPEHPKSATWKLQVSISRSNIIVGLLLGHWKHEEQLFNLGFEATYLYCLGNPRSTGQFFTSPREKGETRKVLQSWEAGERDITTSLVADAVIHKGENTQGPPESPKVCMSNICSQNVLLTYDVLCLR